MGFPRLLLLLLLFVQICDSMPKDKPKGKPDCTDTVKAVQRIPLTICDDKGENVSKKDIDKMLASQPKPCTKLPCDKRSISCEKDSYASFDGSCNNLANPEWGMIGEAQRRLIPPVFNGGFESARLNGQDDVPLPDVRTISNIVLAANKTNSKEDEQFSLWVMAFSQFVDHDITLTPTLKDDGKNIDCCNGPYKDCSSVCLSIHPADDDPHFGTSGVNQKCLNFVRSDSAPCCKQKCTRTPINKISPYFDGTPTYGNSPEQARSLRSGVDGTGATLKVGPFTHEGSYLCKNPDQTAAQCLDGGTNDQYCYKSGDVRMHIVPSLGATITLFSREHNRIVGKLQEQNPDWNNDRLYNEARKIVIAQYQMYAIRDLTADVTLGAVEAAKYGLEENPGYDNVYDKKLNAQVSTVFSTGAYRFGHELINELHGQYNQANDEVRSELLHDLYFRVSLNFKEEGISGVLRYMTQRGSKEPTGKMSPTVRDLLVKDLSTNKSLDLGAINTQRGRDHGLADYNSWRKHCNLPVFPDSHDDATEALIREAYADRVDEIDLFVGGLSETKLTSALVGPLFACLIGEQFERLKKGDRYYYQNEPDSDTKKGRFQTEAQVESLQTLRMSNLICQNTDTEMLQQDVLRRVSNSNPLLNCEDIMATDIDFSLWKE